MEKKVLGDIPIKEKNKGNKMSKKYFFVTIIILIISTSLVYSGIILEGSVEFSTFSDDNLKNAIGSSGTLFGLGIGFEFNKFNLILSGKYLSKSGDTTGFSEEINFQMIPISLIIRYIIMKKSIQPFIGIGMIYCNYEEKVESAIFEDVSGSALGFLGELGMYLKFSKKVFVSFSAKYSMIKDSPADTEVDLGGLSIAIGLVFKL